MQFISKANQRAFLNTLDSFTNETHEADGSNSDTLLQNSMQNTSCKQVRSAEDFNADSLSCAGATSAELPVSPRQRLGHTHLVPINHQGHSNRQPWPPARGSGGHWGHCVIMASSIYCKSMESSSSRREAGFWLRINNADRHAKNLWPSFIMHFPSQKKQNGRWQIFRNKHKRVNQSSLHRIYS